MRAVHRIISVFVVMFLLYLGVTGTGIQLIDLHTLFTHAPASDPNMMAIREDHDGPGEFAVINTGDYTAPALPSDFDYRAALSKLLDATHAAWGDARLTYAELRSRDGSPVGLAQSGRQALRYDFASARTEVGPVPRREAQEPLSIRNTVKHLHRMTTLGDWALWINPVVGVALLVFVITGVVMYLQLLFARQRLRRRNWFWSAGGWWRTLHRWTSIVAALFITVVALSGTFLSYESLIFGFYLQKHPAGMGPQRPVAPLPEQQAPAMLATTLDSYRASLPGEPLKVLRLRVYGGMAQGVVVAGLADDTRQLVFNAATGRRVSETEPGYPDTGFPFGWQAHQIAKQIHRGDYIGLSGRWMDLIAGLSLVYLSTSAVVMYVNLWRRRRQSGRYAWIWI